MTELEQIWADQARYDLDTARAMLDSNRYLYVLFCCQQAVEKALKSRIVGRTGELPPRIHNLLKLVETVGIELQADHVLFLGELSMYYIKTRYPEEIRALGATVTCEIATDVLGKTEEIIQWLFSASK